MIIVANKLYQLQKAPKGDSKPSALKHCKNPKFNLYEGLEICRELKRLFLQNHC
jgi:hypothetical protein